jgi:hypothetical protein
MVLVIAWYHGDRGDRGEQRVSSTELVVLPFDNRTSVEQFRDTNLPIRNIALGSP